MEVIELENVKYVDDGLEAIIFTAQGDMRQVIFFKKSYIVVLFFVSSFSYNSFIKLIFILLIEMSL